MGCHTWYYRRGFKTNKDFPIRHRVNGKWYVEDTKRPVPKKIQYPNSIHEVDYYHDLFRVHNYPNDRLFSLEETIAFIKKNDVKEVMWDDLKEFWSVYPDGMIMFG